MIFTVTSYRVSTRTGLRTTGPESVLIDTDKGCLYDHCRDAQSLKAAYETLGNSAAGPHEMIVVEKVLPLDTKCHCCGRERQPGETGWFKLETNLVDCGRSSDEAACSEACVEKWSHRHDCPTCNGSGFDGRMLSTNVLDPCPGCYGGRTREAYDHEQAERDRGT